MPCKKTDMLQRLSYRLIGVLFIVFVFTSSSLFFPLAVLVWLFTYPFDRRLKALHLFTCCWASLYIWAVPPWRVTISGREFINKDQVYIIVSNHQSLVDILIAFKLFVHFKWVSKAELFNIPLIGWNMRLNRYIQLRRGERSSIKYMYRACERHLKQGSSVYLFPEGTRSTTGKLRKFKEGAFVLAKRLNLPILPIVINGSMNAMPKNSLNFHGDSDVSIKVLPPTFPDEATSVHDLTEYIHKMIRCRVHEENS